MSKHTSGPWKSAMYEGSEYAVVTKTHTVAILDQSYFDVALPDDQVKANARLIAAAPELLEALDNLLGELPRTSGNEMYNQLYAEAERVMIKAKGGK